MRKDRKLMEIFEQNLVQQSDRWNPMDHSQKFMANLRKYGNITKSVDSLPVFLNKKQTLESTYTSVKTSDWIILIKTNIE